MCLPYKHKDPHRESRVCWHELVISVLGEGVETGFLGSLVSRSSLLGKFQTNERLCLKSTGGQCLKKDA